MKRNLLAITILIALAGLTFVQFRLLVTGAKLEKQRFDQRASTALQFMRGNLSQSIALSDTLIQRLKTRNISPEESNVLSDSLQVFMKNELARVGVDPRFSFALTNRTSNDILLASRGFDEEKFTFGEYSISLGDYFSSQLYGSILLHIDMENLFVYLLKELDYLVIPSLICLFAILVCLALLIHILMKEQKLNKIKNDFINNLTHELKTPAFSISLSNKMAKENLQHGNYAKVAEFLQVIDTENNKLKLHIEKVLELASLENAGYSMRKERTDVHPLIEAVVQEFMSQVHNRKGALSCNLKAGQSELKVDADHFKNVLRNLLDNALKYSIDTPKVAVETTLENKRFVLSVRDNGMGISPTHQKLIFDKFYRIPSGNVHRVKGFGLGLSYVQQIVKAHQGKIEVESREGEGTVFRVVLPFS